MLFEGQGYLQGTLICTSFTEIYEVLTEGVSWFSTKVNCGECNATARVLTATFVKAEFKWETENFTCTSCSIDIRTLMKGEAN